MLFAQFSSPLAVRLFRTPQITPRVCEPPEGLCPQFCLRLMAHPSERIQHVMEKAVAMDTGNKEVRNGFGEVSTPPQSSSVRCWMCELLSVDSAHSAAKGGGRKKMRGKSGREGGGRVVHWSESLPHHFSQQTKTFAWISIWSREAVFPSCPVIHHLFLPLPTTSYTSSPPSRAALELEAGQALLRDGLLALCCRLRLRPTPSPYWHLGQHPISHRLTVIHHTWRSIAGRAFIRRRCWWSCHVGELDLGVRVLNRLLMSEFVGVFTGVYLHVRVSICINALWKWNWSVSLQGHPYASVRLKISRSAHLCTLFCFQSKRTKCIDDIILHLWA